VVGFFLFGALALCRSPRAADEREHHPEEASAPTSR